MDAVTYPSSDVGAWLTEKLIPLRVDHDHETLAEQFGVVRTPTLVLLDEERTEIHRSEGFLSPDEFSAFMQLGMAKMKYRRAELESAMDLLSVLVKNHPGSAFLAEAIAVRGRCRYRYTHDVRHLKEAHEQLRTEFPKSRWARLTLQYRLL
jgi:predicted Zn-dependent protease